MQQYSGSADEFEYCAELMTIKIVESRDKFLTVMLRCGSGDPHGCTQSRRPEAPLCQASHLDAN